MVEVSVPGPAWFTPRHSPCRALELSPSPGPAPGPAPGHAPGPAHIREAFSVISLAAPSKHRDRLHHYRPNIKKIERYRYFCLHI